MTKPKILDLETLVDDMLTADYMLGRSAAWGEGADYLLDLSGQAFKSGNDKEAIRLRELVNYFRHYSDNLRGTYKDAYEPKKDEAIQLLEMKLNDK